MSPLHVQSEACIAPPYVRSKVCIAPLYVRSNDCKLALHLEGSNADFVPHMESSHADFCPYMERRHSFRDQQIAKIALSATTRKSFTFKPPIIYVIYVTTFKIKEKYFEGEYQ